MSEYKKTKTNGEVLFEVKPASGPVPYIKIIVALVMAFIITAMGFGILGLILLVIFGIKITKELLQSSKYRSIASFTASPSGLKTKEGLIEHADIHRIILRNHVAGEDFSSIVYGSGIAAASAAIGTELEAKRLNKLGKISYRLDVEHGGKATTLAGGLNETTAYGLMTEVGNILQLA